LSAQWPDNSNELVRRKSGSSKLAPTDDMRLRKKSNASVENAGKAMNRVSWK
jgi:hypothetical protein